VRDGKVGNSMKSVSVYLDLVFLTNVLFDAAMLMVTAGIRRTHIRYWRIIVASIVGALYTILMFFPAFSLLFAVFFKIGFSFILVYIAFGFRSLQHYLRNIGMFYLIHFATAGSVFAVHYLLLSSGEIMSGILLSPSGATAFAVESGLWMAFPVFIGSLFFFRSVFKSSLRTEALTSFTADVRVEIDDTIRCCKGLIDTGNQMYDPLTRTPVMVMDCEQWQDSLPEIWVKRIRSNEVDLILSNMDKGEYVWNDRLRLIPYRGINRGTQFMLALKPDKVVITINQTTYETKKVLIALAGEKLSNNGSYQALVHPMLLEKH
jgi:stage II sporulation protein GA (sporulation sigma-E factor processing peptidase)